VKGEVARHITGKDIQFSIRPEKIHLGEVDANVRPTAIARTAWCAT
jgi:hypothetical protein